MFLWKGNLKMRRLVGILIIALVSGHSWASSKKNNIQTSPETVGHSQEITKKLRAELKSIYPDLQIDSITESPLKGIYQAKIGAQVLYMSEGGQYIIQGDLFDLKRDKKEQNITEELRRSVRADFLKQIKSNDMIVFGPKDSPKGVITVLTDLTCTYCQKLHSEIDELTKSGVQVRYMAFPRSAQGSAAYDKAVTVWCSPDQKDAYSKVIKGEEIPNQTCINSIASQIELGQRFGVRGTPTIVFQDGSIMPGYLPADQLAKEAIEHTAGNSSKAKSSS